MIRASVLATFMALATGSIQSVLRPVTLQDLTVPRDLLPDGCALSPADTVRLDGNQVRGGLWAGLPIPTNPWTGTDALVIARIRERMDPPLLLPDAPPLSAGERARYRLHFADGVEEAYAAIYTQSEPELIVVYASRLAGTEWPVGLTDQRAPRNPRAIRVAIGPLDALVSGDGGVCFQVVGAYLKSLAR